MKVLSMVILDIPNDIEVSLGDLHAKLIRLRGVKRVSVDPVMEKVTVDFNPAKSTINEIRAVVRSRNGESKDDKQIHRHHPRR